MQWEVAGSPWQSSAPETFSPSLPREGSTQEVPVHRTLSIADTSLCIADSHAVHLSKGSERCQQRVLGAQRGVAPWGRHPQHGLFSRGSSFTSSLQRLSAAHTPNSAPEQPDSPADTIILATDGDRAGDGDQELPLMRSACLEPPQTGRAFTALRSICSSGINYRVGAGQAL